MTEFTEARLSMVARQLLAVESAVASLGMMCELLGRLVVAVESGGAYQQDFLDLLTVLAKREFEVSPNSATATDSLTTS